MRLIIDKEKQELLCEEGENIQRFDLYSQEAFDVISQEWLNLGWNQKYSHSFNWLGRPVIQIPEDLMLIQEVLWKTRPDVVVELGVAHGGFAVFLASICKIAEKGRIISVDINLRPHNKKAIEKHPLNDLITLIEGDSTSANTFAQVQSLIREGETVFVILDSNHTIQHVTKELEFYHKLVSVDSYLLVADGIMQYLYDTPQGKREWKQDNPQIAVKAFLEKHSEFVLEHPHSLVKTRCDTSAITYCQNGWLKRKQTDF